jgi:hypothetical protein
VLKNLRPAEKVDPTEHEEAVAALGEKENEIAALQRALEEADRKIAKLQAAKDPAEVQAIMKEYAGAQGLEAQFDALMGAVLY